MNKLTSYDDIATWIRHKIATLVDVSPDEIDVDIPIENYGLGSKDAATLAGDLDDLLDLDLPSSIFYEHEDIRSLSNYLTEQLALGSEMIPE